MPIFILVRQLVLLVCINSALIMSPPARTINETPLKQFALSLYKIKVQLLSTASIGKTLVFILFNVQCTLFKVAVI